MGASCSTDVCGDERSQRHATRPEATVLPAETAARLASMADGFERRLRCLREASGVDEAVGLRVRVAALESGVNCSPEQQRINALLGALESEVSALRAKVALLEAAAVLREAAPAAAAPVAQQLAFQVKRHLEHVVRLRRGEALLINNYRVLHGREGYTSRGRDGRKVWRVWCWTDRSLGLPEGMAEVGSPFDADALLD